MYPRPPWSLPPAASAAPPAPSVGTWRPQQQYQHRYWPSHESSNFGNYDRAGYFQRRPPRDTNAGPSRGRGRGRGWGQHRGGGRHGSISNSLQFNDQHEQQKTRSCFYCCSCERGFQTQVEMDEHNKEHIVCGLDGCQFEAHSLVVTKHIRMQHEGNLFQRMKNLNTPDGINRWREERKKNYPTKERLQQKVAERKEKEERREICGTDAPAGRSSEMGVFRYKIQQQDSNRNASFGEYQHRMRQLQYEQNDDWRNRKYAPDPKLLSNRVPFCTLNTSKIVTLENFYLNVKTGSDGTLIKEKKVKWKGFKVRKLERLEDSESDGEEEVLPISDDEDFYENAAENSKKPAGATGTGNTETPTSKPKATPPSMGLLLVDYSSASDSDNEIDSCEAIAKSAKLTASEQPSKDSEDEILQSSVVGTSTGASDNVKGSQSLSDEAETSDEESMTIDEFEEDAIFKDNPVYLTVGVKGKRKWMREKLLESLLQDQIRKERNTILQACRFITENNFFDKT